MATLTVEVELLRYFRLFFHSWQEVSFEDTGSCMNNPTFSHPNLQ